MPKVYFHQWLAGHTDTASCTREHTTKACMQPPGMHCGFDELVVTSPFTFTDISFSPVLATVRLSLTFFIFPAPPSAGFHYKVSRGPPTA